MKTLRGITVGLLILGLLSRSQLCSAATNVVLNLKDGLVAGTLRSAISNSMPGGVIVFGGALKGTISLTKDGPLIIDKNLTIRGPGARAITISGNDNTRVIVITNADVNLSGLTVVKGLVAGANGFPGVAGSSALGAGILNWHSVPGFEVTVTDCILSHNTVVGGTGGTSAFAGGRNGGDAYGAAVFNNSLLRIENCSFVENSVAGGYGGLGGPWGGKGGMAFGSGVWNIGELTLTNCTFFRNKATGGNGGSTSSGSITFPGQGGNSEGVAVYNSGNLTMISCTIASNTATWGNPGSGGAGGSRGAAFGGGIRTGLGVAEIGNSIVAGNMASDAADVAGVFVSRGHNLIGDTLLSTGFGAKSDQLGNTGSPIDPQFGLFDDQGGPIPTLALRPTSPAVDQGNRFGGRVDQRGAPRPSDFPSISNPGDGSDIGAYELAAPVLDAVRSSSNLLLSWSTFCSGYSLQAATDLGTDQWSAAAAPIVVVGNRFYATNAMSNGSKFFRLSPP